MGVIADSFVAFAQPLIDQTDGSLEQLNKAMAIAQWCYNQALLPADERDQFLSQLQQSLGLADAEFADFRCSIVDPMIRRHEEMFPGMHPEVSQVGPQSRRLSQMQSSVVEPVERRTSAERYAPCPCNSGKKYKFCCGRNPR